jgi:UPF0755 protein
MLARAIRTFALLILVAAAVLGWLAWRAYTMPLPLPAATFAFEVRAGSSLSTVARELGTLGVLPQPLALIALARWRGADRGIKAGSYEFDAGITLPQLLARLTQGDVLQTSFVIVEGATFGDVKRALRNNPGVKNTVLDLSDAEIASRIGIPGASVEGRLFPDTYFFAAGSPDVALLRRARQALDKRLAVAWEHRATNLPYATPEEALILASIVEKETGRAADRPLIASVFVNRLRRGMRLQTDPTVIYGLGANFDGDLRRRDLETDTPYNTYTRDGLPPTPIALPSQAAIDAVMNPPATEFLYFVARGDGTSIFSTSLAEHNRAVSKFQKGGRS